MSEASSQQIQSIVSPAKLAHFTISAELDGFPVTIEIEGKADGLRAVIERLKAIGAAPPKLSRQNDDIKPAGAPVCPIHHTPMKASRKPGSFFCPKRTDDGGYCPEKA